MDESIKTIETCGAAPYHVGLYQIFLAIMSARREIHLKDCDNKELAQCHLMPCLIEHNYSEIKAKEYFWPTIRTLDSDDVDMAAGRSNEEQGVTKSSTSILTASFRGRPLQGRKVTLPPGFKGHVVSKDGKINKKFTEFTYWNWDQIPTDEDKVCKSMSWLKIGEALSS